MKDELLRRLFAILNGTDTHPDFAKIPASDRQAILEILRETMPKAREVSVGGGIPGRVQYWFSKPRAHGALGESAETLRGRAA